MRIRALLSSVGKKRDGKLVKLWRSFCIKTGKNQLSMTWFVYHWADLVLIKKIKLSNFTGRKQGSGRPKTACTEENMAITEELIASWENQQGMHVSQIKIANCLHISHKSINRMKNILKLKVFKRIKASKKDQNVKQKRKTRCRQQSDQHSKDDVKKIIFTDEKILHIWNHPKSSKWSCLSDWKK